MYELVGSHPSDRFGNSSNKTKYGLFPERMTAASKMMAMMGTMHSTSSTRIMPDASVNLVQRTSIWISRPWKETWGLGTLVLCGRCRCRGRRRRRRRRGCFGPRHVQSMRRTSLDVPVSETMRSIENVW